MGLNDARTAKTNPDEAIFRRGNRVFRLETRENGFVWRGTFFNFRPNGARDRRLSARAAVRSSHFFQAAMASVRFAVHPDNLGGDRSSGLAAPISPVQAVERLVVGLR